jgi:hypothetical protein
MRVAPTEIEVYRVPPMIGGSLFSTACATKKAAKKTPRRWN